MAVIISITRNFFFNLNLPPSNILYFLSNTSQKQSYSKQPEILIIAGYIYITSFYLIIPGHSRNFYKDTRLYITPFGTLLQPIIAEN